jgi:sugar/nucleoside kinase (ribokinase family)
MIERFNVISLGLALVDKKIRQKKGNCRNGTIESYPGGITPNITSTYLRLNSPDSKKIYSKVGGDNDGIFYQQASPELFSLQVKDNGETGCTTSIIDSNRRLESSTTEYKSSSEFDVRDSDIERNGPALFISDLYTLQLPEKEKAIQKVMQRMEKQGGFFALNMAGAGKLKSDVITFVRDLGYQPNFICGNQREMKFAGVNGGDLTNYLPEVRLVVRTDAEKGSSIWFQKQHIHIPAEPIEGKMIKDELGAGDCYMGSLLAALTRIPSEYLTCELIEKSASIASCAAASILTNNSSRLLPEQVTEIQRKLNKMVGE